jgi:hypothetical protein
MSLRHIFWSVDGRVGVRLIPRTVVLQADYAVDLVSVQAFSDLSASSGRLVAGPPCFFASWQDKTKA